MGDAVAYLPKGNILIVRDLVDSTIPLLDGGFPVEQISTLKWMEELDFASLVPGYGNVFKRKAFVQQQVQLLEEIRTVILSFQLSIV